MAGIRQELNGSTQYVRKISKIRLALAFDYMYNLPLVNVCVEDIFHLQQLWVLTLGIYDLNLGGIESPSLV